MPSEGQVWAIIIKSEIVIITHDICDVCGEYTVENFSFFLSNNIFQAISDLYQYT